MKFGVEYMEYKFYYDSSKKSFLSWFYVCYKIYSESYNHYIFSIEHDLEMCLISCFFNKRKIKYIKIIKNNLTNNKKCSINN